MNQRRIGAPYFLATILFCCATATADEPDVDLKKAEALFASKDYVRAKEAFERALSSARLADGAAQAGILSRLGDTCAELKDGPGAIAYYRKSLKVAGEDWPERLNVAWRLALVHQKRGHVDASIAVLTEELTRSGQTPSREPWVVARRLLGLLLATKREWREAERVLEDTLSKMPDESRLRCSVMATLAEVLMARGQYVRAEDLLYRYFQVKSRPEDAARQVHLLVVLAELYLRMGYPPDGEALARTAIKELDKIPESERSAVAAYAWSLLGRVLVREGRIEEAADAVGQAQRVDADGALAGLAAIEVAYRRGSYGDVCDIAKRLLVKQEGDATLYVADVLYCGARALDRSGDVEEAGAWYARAVAAFERLDPEHPELVGVLRASADLLKRTGDSEGAARLRERAAKVEREYLETVPEDRRR
ncbi:MAG: tetratricopeptide repeat protein [Planctomycetota bacterium]